MIQHFIWSLLLITFFDSFTAKFVLCLQCYSCNQRVQNSDFCVSPIIEDCSISYPLKQVACIRTVQRSFDGLPPWVFAQCYALGMPTDPQLNQCVTNEIKGNRVLLYTLEICSCTEDLCNGGGTAVTGAPVILPPPFKVTAPSSTLQCYTCNERYEDSYSCRNPTVESCADMVAGQDWVCLNVVQTFVNGDPPWVFAQCVSRYDAMAAAASSTGVLTSADSCNTEYGRFQAGRFDLIHTCVCSTSLCNIGPTPNQSTEATPTGIYPLHCYNCSERVLNGTECMNRTVEDCTVSFPNQPTACVRSVLTFSDGQSPWIVARCQIRALFPGSKPIDCWSQPLTGTGGTNGTDYLQFCTCTTDMCNDEGLMNRTVAPSDTATTNGPLSNV